MLAFVVIDASNARHDINADARWVDDRVEFSVGEEIVAIAHRPIFATTL